MASITDTLLALGNPDPAIRIPAEQTVNQAKESDLSGFIIIVLNELRDDTKPEFSRSMAGTLLKNAIAPSLREVAARKALEEKWKALPAPVRHQVKEEVLSTLGSPTREVRAVAANIIGSLSRIELPANEWPELINILVTAAESNSTQHQEAALMALGYICEEGHDHEEVEDALQPYTTSMLAAILKCMSVNDTFVQFAATNALCNAMEYIHKNMEQQEQRNALVNALCTTTEKSTMVRTRERAMESLVKVAELYYTTLPEYIETIHRITTSAIFKDDETVGLQALQFWISICEIERDMIEEGNIESCCNYSNSGANFIVNIALQLLVRQEEDQTEDDWNLSIAGGKLLQSVAEAVGTDVQRPVLAFVYEKINSTNWHEREAAVMAFGCLLGSPQGNAREALQDTVAQATPGLLKYIRDSNYNVADTSGWVLAIVCEHYVDVFLKQPLMLQQLMNEIGPMIGNGSNANSDEHSINMAKRACHIVHNLALAYEDDDDDDMDGGNDHCTNINKSNNSNNNNNNSVLNGANAANVNGIASSQRALSHSTNELSPFYGDLVRVLLHAIDHSPSTELKNTAQETLNALIDAAAGDCVHSYLNELAPQLMQRMEYQLQLAAQQRNMSEEIETMLALLCGSLSALARKLNSEFAPHLDRAMIILIELLEKYDEHVQDEALVAVGSIAYAMKARIERYLPKIVPYILRALTSFDKPDSVHGTVATLGDLCLACGTSLQPYEEPIMTTLYNALVNPHVDRELKSSFLDCFGDVVLKVLGGKRFVPYMKTLLEVIHSIFTASQSIDIRGDVESEEYVMTLWESTASFYSSMLQSFSEGDINELLPYLANMLSFALYAASNSSEYAETKLAALSVTGDMASVLRQAKNVQLRQQGKEALCTPVLEQMLNEAMSTTISSDEKKQILWIQQQLKHLKRS